MIDMTGTTLHTAQSVGEVLLVRADFSTGTLFLSTSSVPYEWGGNTYIPVANNMNIKGVSESMGEGTDSLSLELSIVDIGMLAYLTGPASVYRNLPITVSLGLCDAQTLALGAVRTRWVGRMDQLKVEREAANQDTGGDSLGKIVLTAKRAGMGRSRRSEGARLSDEQQRTLHPGDTGLRYLRGLIAKPAVWLTKAFQEQ